MCKVILGVHGLGNKPEQAILENWWRRSITEGLRRIDADQEFEFQMIYWANLIYKRPLAKNDPNPSYRLIEDYVPSPGIPPKPNHELRLRVMSYIENQVQMLFLNDDYSLNYEGLSNGIMRRYFKDFDYYFNRTCLNENRKRVNARDHILSSIHNRLIRFRNDEIMLVGHSMGSIIIYDMLRNYTPDFSIKLLCTIGAPLGLPVALNKLIYEGNPMLPKIAITPDNVKRWINLSDPLDLVAFDYQLVDDFLPNRDGISPKDYLVVNDYEKNGRKNPHKSYGYLRSMEFAKEVNDFLND